MASVKVNRGMPRPEAPASSLPKDQWRDLAIVRELWAKSQLSFDCRLLKQVAADAPLMAPELGYDSVESFLKQELQLDPDLVNRVVGWLEQEQPVGPVSLALADAASRAKPLAAHGEIGNGRKDESRVDLIKSTQGGTSQSYLLQRLARDAPEVLERVKSGEIKSARAAAIGAGIITPFPSLQLKDPDSTAHKLLTKKGKEWCLLLLEELSALIL